MAIFSATVGIVGRSKGRQVCASAAYQARQAILDERQGIRFAYSDRDGEELLAEEVVLPEGAPSWDRPALWNAVERSERRKDAQTARIIRLALPRELTFDQMLQLVRRFLKWKFVDRGYAVDFAIHDKRASDGGRQPHVHILVTLRKLSAHGFAAKKDRETFRNPGDVHAFRAAWADAINEALRDANCDEFVDHRSLAAQRQEIDEMLTRLELPPEDQWLLESTLHRLSRMPEPKVLVREWQAARRHGAVPDEIAAARADAQRAAEEADELHDLLRERDLVLQERQRQSKKRAPRRPAHVSTASPAPEAKKTVPAAVGDPNRPVEPHIAPPLPVQAPEEVEPVPTAPRPW
jgi:hypothetical protein